MMLLAVLLIVLSGFAVVLWLGNDFNFFEWTGTALLLGMAVQSFWLFFADILHIPLSKELFTAINMVLVSLTLWSKKKILARLLLSIQQYKPRVNLVVPAVMLLIGWLFYLMMVKNLFWPPTEHDTISSFDKLGRIMAAEGKLHISLYGNGLMGAGGFYPPLWHGLFAYGYLFGAEDPKIFTTLMFAGLLFTFFGLLRRRTGDLIAILATLMLEMVPELYAHGSMSLGNLPTTAYVAITALPLFLWLESRDEKMFRLSIAGLVCLLWIRSDTIVFALASGVVLMIDSIRTKHFPRLFLYATIASLPFILWNAYLAFELQLNQSDRFLAWAEVPAERLSYMLSYISAFFIGGGESGIDGLSVYGLTFRIGYVFFVIHLLFTVIKFKTYSFSDAAAVLYLTISFLAYFILYYLIDEAVQRTAMVDMMESSFKRAVFFFIPVFLFCTMGSKTMHFFGQKLSQLIDIQDK